MAFAPLPPPLCWHTARRACEFNSCGLALVPLESLSVCPTVRVCVSVRREVCLCLWQCVAGADVVGAAHTHTHTHRLSPATRNKREEGAKEQKAFGIFIVSPLAKWRRADKLAADRRKLFGSQHELRQLCLPSCTAPLRPWPCP